MENIKEEEEMLKTMESILMIINEADLDEKMNKFLKVYKLKYDLVHEKYINKLLYFFKRIKMDLMEQKRKDIISETKYIEENSIKKS
jgi:hypothetical protein